MKFMTVLIGFILTGLFAYSLIAFSVQTQLNNDTNGTIMDNQLINSTYSQLGTNLSQLETDAQNQRSAFETDSPTSGIGTLLFGSITGAGRVLTSSVITFGNLITNIGSSSLLGIPPIVLATIGAILLISLVLLVWRLLKVGE